MSELDDEVLFRAEQLTLTPDDTDTDTSTGAGTEVPEGWTRDRKTGEVRPKVKAGRPRKADYEDLPLEARSLEDLKASSASRSKPEDRAPGVSVSKRPRKVRPKKDYSDVPPFRAGPIANGVNRIYAKTGKYIRIVDPMVGQAFIDMTVSEYDGDTTVGQAWENLAKTNPRIRKFLLRCIKGNDIWALVMCHLPILIAVCYKPVIRDHLPGIIGDVLEIAAEKSPDGTGGLPDGITEADTQQMIDLAKSQFGFELTPEMMSMAQGMMGRSANRPRGA